MTTPIGVRPPRLTNRSRAVKKHVAENPAQLLEFGAVHGSMSWWCHVEDSKNDIDVDGILKEKEINVDAVLKESEIDSTVVVVDDDDDCDDDDEVDDASTGGKSTSGCVYE